MYILGAGEFFDCLLLRGYVSRNTFNLVLLYMWNTKSVVHSEDYCRIRAMCIRSCTMYCKVSATDELASPRSKM